MICRRAGACSRRKNNPSVTLRRCNALYTREVFIGVFSGGSKPPPYKDAWINFKFKCKILIVTVYYHWNLHFGQIPYPLTPFFVGADSISARNTKRYWLYPTILYQA